MHDANVDGEPVAALRADPADLLPVSAGSNATNTVLASNGDCPCAMAIAFRVTIALAARAQSNPSMTTGGFGKRRPDCAPLLVWEPNDGHRWAPLAHVDVPSVRPVDRVTIGPPEWARGAACRQVDPDGRG